MCAWLGNSGGNHFSKEKILSMLGYLRESPSKPCGSVAINYPHLKNSYAAMTVKYVHRTRCDGYGDYTQIAQTNNPNNDRGYADG